MGAINLSKINSININNYIKCSVLVNLFFKNEHSSKTRTCTSVSSLPGLVNVDFNHSDQRLSYRTRLPPCVFQFRHTVKNNCDPINLTLRSSDAIMASGRIRTYDTIKNGHSGGSRTRVSRFKRPLHNRFATLCFYEEHLLAELQPYSKTIFKFQRSIQPTSIIISKILVL